MLEDVASADLNELCSNCFKVDIKGLFFGDWHLHVHYEKLRASVGDLREILANSNYPLCRLVVSTRNLNALLEELQLDSHNIDCFPDSLRVGTAEKPFFSQQRRRA